MVWRQMIKAISVMALASFVLVGLAACSTDADRAPYVWPTPEYGVPWTAKTFNIRYSEWWNTEEELAEKVAEMCGPEFAQARVHPHRNEGSVMHPNVLLVECGDVPPPKPEFRGQRFDDSYVIALKPVAGKAGP